MVDSSDDIFKRAGDAADEQLEKMKAKTEEKKLEEQQPQPQDSGSGS